MTAHELLNCLSRQGVSLTPLSDGALKVRPASKLTPELRQELKRCKGELLSLLDVVSWLRTQLENPQRIASVIAEWLIEKDCLSDRQCEARAIDDLIAARWVLGVHAYEQADGYLWWRLPYAGVQ